MLLNTISILTKVRALPLLLALAVALLLTQAARAHASLLRSQPAAGAQLDRSPASLTLEFSAELDPAFSQAQLFDSRNQLVEPGPGEINQAAPRLLRLILPDLPQGSYTAHWRVRSSIDGQISQGSLPFGVGVAATGTALIPPLGAPDPATLPPPPLGTVARWLNLLAAALALGGLPFGLLVWRPAFLAVTKHEGRRTEDDRRGTEDEGTTLQPKRSVPQPKQNHAATEGERAAAEAERVTAEAERAAAEAERATGEEVPYHNRSRASENNAETLLWPAVGGRWSKADDSLMRFIQRTTALGGLLFILTNLFFLLTQAADAANVPLAQAIGTPALQLLSGRAGLLWLARLALILQIVVLAWRLPPAGRGASRLWWALLAVGGVVVLTLSLLSHAAANPAAAIAVPLDWLHLAAMITWLGGLLPLSFAITLLARNHGEAKGTREQAVLLGLLISRFSRLTVACAAILTLTGIYNYTLQIGTLDLLIATTYGRALLIKLVLFGTLLLGALKLFGLSRRLYRRTMDDGRTTKDERRRTIGRRLLSVVGRQKSEAQSEQPSLMRTFGRSVRWELLAGALLLLAVGVMSSVVPSKIAWEQHEQQGIAQSATVGDVGLTLRIAPAQIGDNEFAVDVADTRPGAAAAPARVLLRFDMLGMDMGKLEAAALPAGAERYSTRGSYTSMGGRWQIQIVLQRAGFDDLQHTFVVDILRGTPFVISQ
jgi:putative copper export protein/methionine-rich copper-binding protein CopC